MREGVAIKQGVTMHEAFFRRLHLQGHNHLIILILNFLLSSARRKKQRSIHPLQGLLFLFISLMQEKRNQRVHDPQGPLQRGMQPLRLSLLHLGILDPSKGRDVFLSTTLDAGRLCERSELKKGLA